MFATLRVIPRKLIERFNDESIIISRVAGVCGLFADYDDGKRDLRKSLFGARQRQKGSTGFRRRAEGFDEN
jgi:hypothetical protein